MDEKTDKPSCLVSDRSTGNAHSSVKKKTDALLRENEFFRRYYRDNGGNVPARAVNFLWAIKEIYEEQEGGTN